MTDTNSANDFRRRVALLSGIRQITIAALRERIENQFNAELPPEVAGQISPDERRERLREVTDYVLETEVIRLPRQDKLALIDVLYADLFQFGILDPLINTPEMTEIVIDGAAKIYARQGQGAAQLTGLAFDSDDDYRRVLTRALNGVPMPDEMNPFVETGTMLLGRHARLTIAAPPISPHLHTEIRLHLDFSSLLIWDLMDDFIHELDIYVLSEEMEKRRGIMIVGDVATGKTTLVQALVDHAPLPNNSALVERAAEMDLEGRSYKHFTGTDFSQQITDAAATDPEWLVIDEIRFDEGAALLPILQKSDAPHLLWAFRGATRADRLFAAFEMSIRRAAPTIETKEIVRFLVEKLPVVVLCGRKPNQSIGVISIGEWHAEEGDPTRAKLHL